MKWEEGAAAGLTGGAIDGYLAVPMQLFDVSDGEPPGIGGAGAAEERALLDLRPAGRERAGYRCV